VAPLARLSRGRGLLKGMVALAGTTRGIGVTLALVATALLLATVLLHLRTAQRRFIDPDELEHLNAASFVAQGETLYGSIFENHPPLTTAVLQPVVRSSDDPGTILARGRLLSLAVTLATLCVVAGLGRTLAGWPGAALAPLLLSTHTFFAQKSIEVRPDVYSTFLLVLALFALIGGLARGSWRRLVLGGVLIGLGGFFTPKIVYAAAGTVLGAVVASAPGAGVSPLRARTRVLLAVGLGAGLVTAAATLEMARRGMFPGFISDCLVVSSKMSVTDPDRFRRVLSLQTLRENSAFWILGLAGLGVFLRLRGTALRPSGAILGFSLVTGLAGLLHIEAPLRQYYLTFLPQVALSGALAFVALLRYVGRRWSGAPPWLTLALGLAACTLPPGLHLLREQPSKDRQLQVIDRVCELSAEGERVFDCWTGLYLTRLPAYRYFYLNSDVLRLLDRDQLREGLLSSLDNPKVKVVIVDRFFEVLPVAVRARIQQEFVAVSGFPLLVRRPAGPPREQ